MTDPEGSVRLDKWLWFARFFRTRSLAAKAVRGGGVRINGDLVSKSHATVTTGDMLTFSVGRHVKIVEILAPGTRRGPAPEAQSLYEDRSPPPEKKPETAGEDLIPFSRDAGAGRPTKRDRRALDRLRDDDDLL